MKIKQPSLKQRPKKPYAPPKLVRHGDMRALTRAGNGSRGEVMSQGRVKKP
jgi:hypothetical protein